MMCTMRIVKLIAFGAVATCLLLTGCTPSPVPTSLKTTCDSLSEVLRDGGQAKTAAPEMMAKLHAIAAAGDQSSKDALQPFVDAMDKVAGGDRDATAEAMQAGIRLATACTAVGSTWGAMPSSSPSASATPEPGECGLASEGVVAAILDESGRTASASASVRGGKGMWLVALKLRSGEVTVWVVDSVTDPTTILSVDVAAKEVSGWGLAGVDDFDPARVPVARACVG